MIKINLKTNELKRESLPNFLKGLEPESLLDLSWTDEALGVQDLAWYPEIDVTIYDDTKVLDGTETLEVDSKNKIVKVTKGQRDKTAEELETELAEAQRQTRKEMLQAIESLIQGEIDKYNEANMVAFKDIDACAKYTTIPTYTHYQFCVDVIVWQTNVWETARTIQADVLAGTRPIPTTEEFISELPVFGS